MSPSSICEQQPSVVKITLSKQEKVVVWSLLPALLTTSKETFPSPLYIMIKFSSESLDPPVGFPKKPTTHLCYNSPLQQQLPLIQSQLGNTWISYPPITPLLPFHTHWNWATLHLFLLSLSLPNPLIWILSLFPMTSHKNHETPYGWSNPPGNPTHQISSIPPTNLKGISPLSESLWKLTYAKNLSPCLTPSLFETIFKILSSPLMSLLTWCSYIPSHFYLLLLSHHCGYPSHVTHHRDILHNTCEPVQSLTCIAPPLLASLPIAPSDQLHI